MRRILLGLCVLGLSLATQATALALDEPPADVALVLKAGKHDRHDHLARAEIRDVLAPAVRTALEKGPIALSLFDGSTRLLAQADRSTADPSRIVITWFQPGSLKAGEEKTVRLQVNATAKTDTPWQFHRESAGTLELTHGPQRVFRYNSAPVLEAGLPEIQRRDAYLHPVYTPSGVLATGDFSKFHTHHRGIFLAYAKMKVKGEIVDVWNIHNVKIGGKIHHESLGNTQTGPVSASFSAKHRWETRTGYPFLEESWVIEAYDVPGSPYWLFDITSTQTAIDTKVELLPYRYGGMAYRGPEPFVKGKLDVLTSEGRGRVDGDQKPTRWVDLTGPISEGSTLYAGAMIADHPSNINHPTVARIHPTSLPFFSYVPSHQTHNQPIILESHESIRFRYRVLIHDGHPDRLRDESIWRDFADPVEVTVAPPK